MTDQSPRGFTMIEMLVVLTILTILSGMVMTMISQARRGSMRSATMSVERKVETALRLFKDEYAVYPYQQTYPDLSPTTPGQYFPNHLYYHLGTNIPTAVGGDRDNVVADMTAAKAQYAYICDFNANVEAAPAAQPSKFTYLASMVIETGSMHRIYNPANPALSIQQQLSIATLLNRMAQEWSSSAMLAGAVGVKGPVIFDQFGAQVEDLSALPILSSAKSAGNPGWADDLLAGDLESRYLSGDDILDAWHHPLVYICQVVPGVKSAAATVDGQTLVPFDSRYYGLGPQGFATGSGPTASLKTAGRQVLLNSGRVSLNLTDAGDGQPTPADPTYFPNNGCLMQSDMRFYAPAGDETEFELWSAGFDGLFSYMRTDPGNADNISATDFNRELR